MSDPKTPEDSPKTTEEMTGSVEEKKDTPENTSADEKEKPQNRRMPSTG